MTGDDVVRSLDHLPPGTATILGEAGHLFQHQPAARRTPLSLEELLRQVASSCVWPIVQRRRLLRTLRRRI